jgi:heptaprenylglyceryl phosphate synthase
MPLVHYSFIVKAQGYRLHEHLTSFDTPLFKTTFVGVSTVEEAETAATELVLAGTQLIELCGGFTRAEAARIEAHIADAVVVGVVIFTAEQEARLARD